MPGLTVYYRQLVNTQPPELDGYKTCCPPMAVSINSEIHLTGLGRHEWRYFDVGMALRKRKNFGREVKFCPFCAEPITLVNLAINEPLDESLLNTLIEHKIPTPSPIKPTRKNRKK